MNRKLACILVFSLSLVAFAHGQIASNAAPVVMGQGTPTYLPVWTSHNRIGNSILFQADGDIGLGTTTPFAKLDVESNGTIGIWGATSSTAPFATGVSGQSASPSGNGVVGEATSSTGINNGVFGRSASTSGNGVGGIATATTGNTYGVSGQTNTAGFGAGVIGSANANTGTAFGVFGGANGTSGNGVFGYASATSGYTSGVAGFVESPNGTAGQFTTHSGSGLLLTGNSGSSFTQVFYVDASGNGYFAGNLNVIGNLSKGSGSFKIDDPLDPANKTLSHSFVESPDMKNIYDGVVQLDANGQVWVDLPQYFDALNRDFRYQLTAIGAPGPGLYIAQEIAGNRFKIEGGKPGAKVSWQVTGVRQDAYAKAHRVPVEEDKAATERGYYLHPDAFGQPQSKGIEMANGTQPSTIDSAKLAAISNAGPRTAQ
jgi:hypothetical protein